MHVGGVWLTSVLPVFLIKDFMMHRPVGMGFVSGELNHIVSFP